jgi:hypothetical protein
MSILHACQYRLELNCSGLTAAVDNANISNAFERAWGGSTISILPISFLSFYLQQKAMASSYLSQH